MNTICLTGMMGSGKTTIAKLFASRYGIVFYDVDSVIEKQEGMSISDIFQKKGEGYFRLIEKNTIKSIFKNENMIISLGGGAFENEETRQFLLNNSKVIYLQTSAQEIYNRIKNDNTRPLLCDNMSVEKINEILQKREKNYLLAHKVIITDNKTPEQIILELNND